MRRVIKLLQKTRGGGGARDTEGTTKGTKIAITENKQPRRREKGLSRQEAERSRPTFLYTGVAADKPRAQSLTVSEEWSGFRLGSLEREMREDMRLYSRDEAVAQVGF